MTAATEPDKSKTCVRESPATAIRSLDEFQLIADLHLVISGQGSPQMTLFVAFSDQIVQVPSAWSVATLFESGENLMEQITREAALRRLELSGLRSWTSGVSGLVVWCRARACSIFSSSG